VTERHLHSDLLTDMKDIDEFQRSTTLTKYHYS